MWQIIYAALREGSDEPLLIGTARAPITSDYAALYRLVKKLGAMPDVLVLEEFDPDKSVDTWAEKKVTWRAWFHNYTEWDYTVNAAANYRMKKVWRARLFDGKTLVKGVDLIAAMRKKPLPMVLPPASPD